MKLGSRAICNINANILAISSPKKEHLAHCNQNQVNAEKELQMYVLLGQTQNLEFIRIFLTISKYSHFVRWSFFQKPFAKINRIQLRGICLLQPPFGSSELGRKWKVVE